MIQKDIHYFRWTVFDFRCYIMCTIHAGICVPSRCTAYIHTHTLTFVCVFAYPQLDALLLVRATQCRHRPLPLPLSLLSSAQRSADIPLSLRKFYYATGDREFLSASWRLLNETCRFWECRFTRVSSRARVCAVMWLLIRSASLATKSSCPRSL